ncbi:hypothetical protein [Terrabacter sp. NPDC000476]|uniref:hypothetical protein n=1 Tax=Terrabacter sp. NPDC000476 TaxID=3154258 RepID=UPI003328CE6F
MSWIGTALEFLRANAIAVVGWILGVSGWLSAFFERSAARTARSELDLAVRQDSAMKANWFVHLESATLVREPDNHLLEFSVLVANRSHMENSITGTELRIVYDRAEQRDLVLYAHGWRGGRLTSSYQGADPLLVAGKGAALLDARFAIPREALAGTAIRRYELVLTDGEGGNLTVVSSIPMEVIIEDSKGLD